MLKYVLVKYRLFLQMLITVRTVYVLPRSDIFNTPTHRALSVKTL